MATRLKWRTKRGVTGLRPPPGGPMAHTSCMSASWRHVLSARSYLKHAARAGVANKSGAPPMHTMPPKVRLTPNISPQRNARTRVSALYNPASSPPAAPTHQPLWSRNCRSSSTGGWAPYTSSAGMLTSSTNTTQRMPTGGPKMPLRRLSRRASIMSCEPEGHGGIAWRTWGWERAGFLATTVVISGTTQSPCYILRTSYPRVQRQARSRHPAAHLDHVGAGLR